jgi:hypothetical protein
MKFGIKLTKLRFGTAFVLLSLALSPWLSACGGGSNGSTIPGNAHIKDENNYTITSKLTIPVRETQPGVDLQVCWDQVKTDFMGHAVTGDTAIKGVHWGQITRLTEEQIADQFAIGTFDSTKSVKKIRTFPVPDPPPSPLCATLSQFHTAESYLVPAQDYVVSVDEYMLLFASSQVQGEGTRSAMFIKPTDGSAVTKVDGPDGGPELQFSADFNKPKVDIPAAGPWVVEWSQLTQDGVGTEVVYQNIDSLRLAFYPAWGAADLAANALNYDRIQGATYYKVSISSGDRSADLAAAQTDSAQAFTGFSPTNGLWVVALECSKKCYLPAPVAVAILNPT